MCVSWTPTVCSPPHRHRENLSNLTIGHLPSFPRRRTHNWYVPRSKETGTRTAPTPHDKAKMANSPAADEVSTHLETSTASSGQQVYPHKRLIVCCDGTWNSGDLEQKSLTNVAKIARCIADVDSWQGRDEKKTYIQIVHYLPGIGLGTSKVANGYDALTGRGLSMPDTFLTHYQSLGN